MRGDPRHREMPTPPTAGRQWAAVLQTTMAATSDFRPCVGRAADQALEGGHPVLVQPIREIREGD